jgi:uncharacterized caspase-like protein
MMTLAFSGEEQARSRVPTINAKLNTGPTGVAPAPNSARHSYATPVPNAGAPNPPRPRRLVTRLSRQAQTGYIMGDRPLWVCFLRRRIVLLRVVLFSFLLLLVSPVAHAEKRVALVIGNSAYRPPGELINPRNDATDVAAALKSHGFQVIEGFDLDKVALDRKLRDFAAALAGADVGLFFYAGHGLQVSGQNYIVPIDAQLTTLASLELEVTRFESVQRIMESEDRTNILFFDACRNNPLARNLRQAMGTRSTAIGRGLAPVQSGHGTLISFSTQPGNEALDGNGRNSPFTGALLRHLSSSNDEIMALLVDVRVDVMRETNRRQIPWEHTALTGRFYFKARANPAPPPNISNPVLPVPATPQTSASDAERSRVAYNQGIAALERGDFDQAVADFSEVIRLQPTYAWGFNSRGYSYHKKKEFNRAVVDYDEAIRLDPKFVDAFNNRGILRRETGEFDKAIADFNEAIRLNPTFAWGFNNRANAYFKKNDFDRAIADFNEAIKLDPQYALAFANRGLAYALKNDLDRAIENFNEAIRLDPNYPNAWYHRGVAKQKKGDKSGDADIARARQLNPSIGK